LPGAFRYLMPPDLLISHISESAINRLL